ncbi:MAG: signal peptidase II [Bacillota bacterium]
MPALLITAAVLFFDQLSKWIIQETMELGQSIPVITNIFHITYWRNPGAAFGIMAFRTNFFIIVGFLVVAAIIIVLLRLPPERKLLKVALALQLGGAVGNLIDRIRTGYVVDFFDFRVWPVFNIADSAIVIGVILLSWFLLVTPETKPKPNG